MGFGRVFEWKDFSRVAVKTVEDWLDEKIIGFEPDEGGISEG